MSITEPSRPLTIAEVAALSGLSAHTLRYYERIGLLDPVMRVRELRRQGDGTVAARRALLEEHRDDVLERIAELQRDLAAVTYKITNYEQLEHTLAHRHSHT